MASTQVRTHSTYTMTEEQLVNYILERVSDLYPKFTHEQQLAYALGFMASQICVSIDHDNKYYYRIKDALNAIASDQHRKI